MFAILFWCFWSLHGFVLGVCSLCWGGLFELGAFHHFLVASKVFVGGRVWGGFGLVLGSGCSIVCGSWPVVFFWMVLDGFGLVFVAGCSIVSAGFGMLLGPPC